MAMMKCFASIVLILAIGGSALAGVPLHSEGRECGMSSDAMSEEMDCCRMAQMQSDSAEVLVARLCCMMNCPQPGPTGTSTLPTQFSNVIAVAFEQATIQQPVLVESFSLQSRSKLSHSADSHPAYILHHSLLI